MGILFLPFLLLTILYTINISFLLRNELTSNWKKVTLLFNIIALICAIPTFFMIWFIFSLGVTLGSSNEGVLNLTVIATIIYFFVVNLILTVLMIKKKTISNDKKEPKAIESEVYIDGEDSIDVKKNKILKMLSFVFLYAIVVILVSRSWYADDKEILFIKGFYEYEIYVFTFLAIISTIIVTVLIVSFKKTKVLHVTSIILGSLTVLVLILNFIIKPNDYTALSKSEKEAYLLSSTKYLEEIYPEGIETSKIKFGKSDLGGKYVRVSLNYNIKNCDHKCGPYKFESDYHIHTNTRKIVQDTGQILGNQTIDTDKNDSVSFIIKDEESIIQKEEKQIFIEKGKEADLKQQVIALVNDGYDFSTNNGLPTHPDNHFDRLKYTKYKKNDYEKLLAMDGKDFYDSILSSSPYVSSGETDFVLYPLGEDFGKIVIEVSPKGYVIKGLAFKTVDSRKRFVFDLGNGETFTGILESDHQFRTDRVWVTIEDKGTSKNLEGEFVEVKY